MNVKFLIVLIAYMVFVFWLSIKPMPEDAKDLFPYQDKIVHFILYSLLAIIAYLVFQKSTVEYKRLTLWLFPILLALIYGWAIEVYQLYVPTRSFEVNDIIVNCFGGIAGSTVMQAIVMKR